MFVILVWSLLPQSAPLVDRVRHLGVANLVKSLNPGVEQHFPLILSSNVCQSAHAHLLHFCLWIALLEANVIHILFWFLPIKKCVRASFIQMISFVALVCSCRSLILH